MCTYMSRLIKASLHFRGPAAANTGCRMLGSPHCHLYAVFAGNAIVGDGLRCVGHTSDGEIAVAVAALLLLIRWLSWD